jgi:Fe-S cluster assembly iron-binding protein IscA
MLVKKLFSFLVCSTFALSVQSQLSAVDYKDEKFNSQFIITNPEVKSTCGCGSSVAF